MANKSNTQSDNDDDNTQRPPGDWQSPVENPVKHPGDEPVEEPEADDEGSEIRVEHHQPL